MLSDRASQFCSVGIGSSAFVGRLRLLLSLELGRIRYLLLVLVLIVRLLGGHLYQEKLRLQCCGLGVVRKTCGNQRLVGSKVRCCRPWSKTKGRRRREKWCSMVGGVSVRECARFCGTLNPFSHHNKVTLWAVLPQENGSIVM